LPDEELPEPVIAMELNRLRNEDLKLIAPGVWSARPHNALHGLISIELLSKEVPVG